MDNQADVARLDRGLHIRRPKMKRSLINDARIKNCINRYDSGAYTPMQFLDAMSHNMDAHTSALNDHLRGDSDDDDDGADEDEAQTTDQTPPQDAAVTSEPATRTSDDFCEVSDQPADISVSASRVRRRCISVGTDVHSTVLTLLWSFVCIKAVD